VNAKSYQAWTKAIISLIIAIACFVLAKGYPLAFWGGLIWLGISLVGVVEALSGMRPKDRT
jgi:hypothetical protein